MRESTSSTSMSVNAGDRGGLMNKRTLRNGAGLERAPGRKATAA